MKSPWTRCFALVVALALTAAACGSDGDGGDSASAAGGEQSTGPVSGDLTFFAYEDAFEPDLLDPFEAANPDLNVRNRCLLER